MSERAPNTHETQHGSHEFDRSHEKRAHKHHEAQANAARHEHQERIDSILETIEKEASSAKDAKFEKQQEVKKNDVRDGYISDRLEAGTRQSLQKIQDTLPTIDRKFSKIIHQPAVDAISEITGQTVARPSGLLFGGSFALLTNIAVIIVCRRYGYEYNYFIGIASFGVGYLLGLFFEFLYKRIRTR